MRTIRAHPVAAYFVLAYAIAWAVWIPMALAGVRVYQGSAWPTHLFGLFGPVVAAVAITVLIARREGLREYLRRLFRWRVGAVWYAAAFSPVAFFAIAAVASAATGAGWPDLNELGSFSGLPVLAAPLMWVALLVLAYAEEGGWRGFAVPKLLERHGLLATALVVGVLWAAWHVPSLFVIENYRELGVSSLPGFFIGIVSGSIFLAWLYRASGGSVFICALWHATYNLFAGTAAAHGTVAAVVSMGVMTWALIIVVIEIWRQMRSRSSRRAHSPS